MVTYPKDWKIITPFFTMHDSKRVPVAEGERPAGNTPYYGANGIQGYIKDFTHSGDFVLIAEDGACDIYNYPVKYVSGDIWVNNHAHVIQGIEGISDTKFLSYALANYDFTPILVGGTRVKLNGKALQNIKIKLPLFKEQKAIADTLSTFDEHIENLTKLIKKKKAIRDGALEDLVTGKTRLDGFERGWDKTTSYPRDWEENRLDYFVYIYQGGTPSTANKSYWDGDIVWLTPSDVTKHTSLHIYASERKITEEGLLNSSATLLPKGTILLCTRATIGELAIAGRPLATNQGFKNLVCRSNADSTFLAYLLGTKKEELLEKASGTTFLELSLRELSKIKVLMPPLREQQAIASVLTVMDEEINSLEQENNKIIQLRDGAMDDLLTGKIRLV